MNILQMPSVYVCGADVELSGGDLNSQENVSMSNFKESEYAFIKISIIQKQCSDSSCAGYFRIWYEHVIQL